MHCMGRWRWVFVCVVVVVLTQAHIIQKKALKEEQKLSKGEIFALFYELLLGKAHSRLQPLRKQRQASQAKANAGNNFLLGGRRINLPKKRGITGTRVIPGYV